MFLWHLILFAVDVNHLLNLGLIGLLKHYNYKDIYDDF